MRDVGYDQLAAMIRCPFSGAGDNNVERHLLYVRAVYRRRRAPDVCVAEPRQGPAGTSGTATLNSLLTRRKEERNYANCG